MRARGAAIQGGLAVVALIAAYVTWQREPERAPGEVVIVDATRSELRKVRFDDGVKWVELWREDDQTWLRHGTRPQEPKAQANADGGTAVADGGTAIAAAGAADGGTPRVEVPPPTTKLIAIADRQVKGNEAATRLLERFTPLRGNRALGVLPQEKLKELGLTETTRSLELTLGSGVRAFKVSSANALLSAPYLLDAKDQRVYLVPGSLISDLDAATSRSVDRRLHTFAEPEYDAATVKIGDAERAFVQTGATVADLRIAPKATPDKPDEFARNWLHRVFALVPSEVFGKGEVPPGGEPKLEGRIEYARGGKPIGFIELATGEKNALLVRTEHSAGWVRVQIGAPELVADGRRIVSGG